ncbi:hypothetical protein [Lactiplantibacillus fabifermentans]|nr:hypothetical protein [Lactiplantibacillus fabifermentans]ETY74884.1 hypothetical protein LFAB_05105 [Lactiplantibacillus fabifermentans T30PCM01]
MLKETKLTRIIDDLPVAVKLIKKLSASEIAISQNEQKNAELYIAEVMQQRIILISYAGSHFKWLYGRLVTSATLANLPVVLLLPQLESRIKRQFLLNNQSFITYNGETFLPCLGIRLFATPSAPRLQPDFTYGAQRLALVILLAQLAFENELTGTTNWLSAFSRREGLLLIESSQKFVNILGPAVGMNNRSAFKRAMDVLVANEMVQVAGTTRNRQYYCQLASQQFWSNLSVKMITPFTSRRTYYLQIFPEQLVPENVLTSGFTALSQLTLIGDNPYVTSATDLSAMANVTKQRLVPGQKYCLQVAAYPVAIFASLYRQINHQYPEHLLDPFHLYISLQNEMDERVQDELAELIDQIWEE